GDYDNDGRPDLLVLRSGGNVLFHNDGNGRFSDATARAGLPPYPFPPSSAAFVDFDHDGDLDLVLAGAGAPVRLVRNNGDGTFTDITATTGIDRSSDAIGILPTDYDDRRDIDILVTARDAPPALFKNLRDGRFRDVAAEVALRVEGRFTSAAAADINK